MVSNVSHTVLELKQFFFEAALATYANKTAKKGTLAEIPGTKTYRYPEESDKDGLVYFDNYWTNGEYSGGVTIIQENGVAIWKMNYEGWCKGDDRTVLDFLKEALIDAYQRQEFRGGRGPARYETGQFRWSSSTMDQFPLVYENIMPDSQPTLPNGQAIFEFFSGRERITHFGFPDEELFWHQYNGMLFRTVAPAIQPWAMPGRFDL